jgi:methionyl-tRNA formyltransferase
MAMEEGLDTGPVLLERSISIGLLENAQQLGQRLAQLSAELLVEALPRIETAGTGPEAERIARLGVRVQGEVGLSYARMLTKDDLLVNWNQSALEIHRRVMGLYPGAVTQWQGKRLKLLATEPLVARLATQLSPEARYLLAEPGVFSKGALSATAAPGTVLALAADAGLVVGTAGCPLLIRAAQLEGKSPAQGQSLLQQLGCSAGDQLGIT